MLIFLWHETAPWENGYLSGPNSGLYKSEDGGNTWKKLTTGLPAAEKALAELVSALHPVIIVAFMLL